MKQKILFVIFLFICIENCIIDNLNIREPDTPWVEAGKGYGIGE